MRYFAILSLVLILSGCNSKSVDMDNFHKIYGGESAEIYLNEISDHTIIFGHQSVGDNILSGIDYFEKESGVQLNRIISRDSLTKDDSGLMEFNVGRNGDPYAKIDDFVSVVESIPDDVSAIAFFKFCWADFMEDAEVNEPFDYYRDRMLYLKENHDHVSIVLVTIPLTRVQDGLKAAAKKVLKKRVLGPVENYLRYQFNERVLNELSDEFPVFDLAAIESTLPDGKLNTYKLDGVEYPCVPVMYTYDFGHLNELGSRIVAYNLLAFLAEKLK